MVTLQKNLDMKVEDIDIAQFDYPLPPERIAKHPLAERDECLLLVADRNAENCISTHKFKELPQLLPADTLLICNNTRVIKARLRMRKPTGAAIEIFCLEPHKPADYATNLGNAGPVEWICLVGNSKRWTSGPVEMNMGDTILRAERVNRLEGGESIVRLNWDNNSLTFADILEKAGETPIPPYLERDSEASDDIDYQTVYSSVNGSVAAPTAGLHFTPEVLENLTRAGISREEVTLHVGAGTFRPVTSGTIGGHNMHSEAIDVRREVVERLLDPSKRVVAVGTTSVRTLESLYHIGCLMSRNMFNGELPQWYPYSPDHPRLSVSESLHALLDGMGDRLIASTRLMIAPGYEYMIVRGMVTNFHQPKSTLLLLVSAFLGGGDYWRRIYDSALAGQYRFLSYGDACLFI